jgi:hypothetical protein
VQRRYGMGAPAPRAPADGAGVVQRKAAVVQLDEKEDARALEARDGGHSLDRHGPDLSKEDLKRRLSTGYAPDGAFSPAPGYSTKFGSYGDYLQTRETVSKQIQIQARHTHKELRPTWDAYIEACRAFDESDPGPGRVPLIAARAQARTALEQAAAAHGARNVSLGYGLGVQFVGGAAATNAIQLCGRYGVGHNHGRSIGMGYEGTNPLNRDDPRGGEFTSYRNFTELDEIKKTHSSVNISGTVVLTGSLDAGAFEFGQHFPAPAAVVGIRSN